MYRQLAEIKSRSSWYLAADANGPLHVKAGM
jgi:hypothetical protein